MPIQTATRILPRSVLLLLITIATLALLIAVALSLIAQPFVGPIKSTVPEVDAAKLAAHVKHLTQDFFPRSSDQFNNLDQTAQYIMRELQANGASVSVQNVPAQGKTYKNLIAKFGPATGPVIVVGAHYDSNGYAKETKHPNGTFLQTHTPGADDNASGVAGLLELARLLSAKPPTRAIELVAYTLEEMPHFRTPEMGSFQHARALKEAGREVQLMLSIEMIGYFSDQANSQAYPAPGMKYLYSDRGNFIGLVGKFSHFKLSRRVKAIMRGATDLPVFSINAPTRVEGIDFSDQLNYWNLGYPAFMITDTSFMRNPHYHEASDTYNTLDYPRMAKVVQQIYAITQQL